MSEESTVQPEWMLYKTDKVMVYIWAERGTVCISFPGNEPGQAIRDMLHDANFCWMGNQSDHRQSQHAWVRKDDTHGRESAIRIAYDHDHDDALAMTFSGLEESWRSG